MALFEQNKFFTIFAIATRNLSVLLLQNKPIALSQNEMRYFYLLTYQLLNSLALVIMRGVSIGTLKRVEHFCVI